MARKSGALVSYQLAWRLLGCLWLGILGVIAISGVVLLRGGPLPEPTPPPHDLPPPVPPALASSLPPAVPAPLPTGAAAPSPPSVPLPTPPSPPTPQRNADQEEQVVVTLRVSGSQDGHALAKQLADQLKLDPDQVASLPGSDPGRRAIIRFYAAEDHQLARLVGQKLVQLGYAWQIENLADRTSSQGRHGVEVLLPPSDADPHKPRGAGRPARSPDGNQEAEDRAGW